MKRIVIIITFILILLALSVMITVRFKKIPFLNKTISETQALTNNNASRSMLLEQQLIERLSNLEVARANITRQVFKEDSAIELKASIPRGRPMECVIWEVTSRLKETGYTLDDCYFNNEEKGCRIQFSCKEPGNPLVILHLIRSSIYFSHTAKMAIFVEDFGFQADQTTVEYLSFPEPLTVGLIPAKKLTTWTAQIANEYRKEIIIMLPMEPLPFKLSKQYDSVIMVHYPANKIKHIIAESMQAIPHFSGVTNYYGARVIDDSEVMSLIFSDISNKKAYFLYNQQAHSLPLKSIAKKYNLPIKPIDICLDSNTSISALQDTLRHCAMIAQNTGDIIVSSKPTTAFINALKHVLPILKQNGIKLVYVSDLMPKRNDNKD